VGHPQGVVEGRRTLCPTLLAKLPDTIEQLHGRSVGLPSYPLKPTNMIARAPITARIGSTSPWDYLCHYTIHPPKKED